MDLPEWSIPVVRLPTIVTTQISSHLPFPVPAEPSSSTNGTLHSTDSLPAPEILSAVAAILESTNISHVRPRQKSLAFHPQPGSLEYAILQYNQHAFAYAARSIPNVNHGLGTSAKGQEVQQLTQQPQQQQPSAAERLKLARHLPTKEAQVPAPKRRKRAVSTDEEFVSSFINGQQVADDVAAAISSFVEKAESLQSTHEYSGDEADSSDSDDEQQPQSSSVAAAAGHKQSIHQPFLPLDLLKDLQTHLSQGRQAGVMGQLDIELLRRLLKVLVGHVQLGDGKLLDGEDAVDSAAGKAVAASLEAACCCLQLLAASGLPNSLYLDELLTAAVQMTKYQLQFNVLAFLHLPYRQLYRPSAVVADAGQITAVKKRARVESASRMPPMMKSVQAKLELLLCLLAQVVDHVLLEVELLLPLVRVALTCLQVDSLRLLQAQALAFTVAVFRAYPQQRPAILDEVLTTVIGNIAVVSSRGPVRLFETTDAALRPLPVMMATALVMQLVEASVQLPAVDAAADTIMAAFQGAYGCCDVFWKGVFAHLPAAKAAKSDGAADFKLIVEAMLADLSAVQMLPEWPAATILLRGFLKVLYSDKGLKNSDAAVKLAAVEFTGKLTAYICAEALAAEKTADEVHTLLGAASTAADPSLLVEAPERCPEQLIHLLVLDYLSAAAQGGHCSTQSSGSITAAARRFICCRMLHDTLYMTKRQLAGAEVVKEELLLLLMQHRQLQDSVMPVLGSSVSKLGLSRAQHVTLVRWWVMHGPLGAGRATLIKWLVEAGSREGKDPNPATVRTKVFKCLGSVVESDSRVLALPDVSAAVRAALEDDSVAVREAALELLAKLIHSNPKLAGDYFDVLVQASHDAGVSVRKRAIRSLWDCCNCSDFTRATEAVVTVLQRALDPEESMRSLVTKVCGDMWFLEGSSFLGLSDVPASSGSALRTADVRARELADVALRAYEAGGKAIHVPLAQDYPLVVILKEVLGVGSIAAAAGKDMGSLRARAEEVAQALLNMVLQQQELDTEDDGASCSSTSAGAFPYLLALHALCCADASVAAPEADPQRFVRCLAPYISLTGVQQGILSRTNSTASGSSAPAEDSTRRSAEECLCLLSVLEALLQHLGALEQDTMKQMMSDLLLLINKQRYLQLVAVACQVLCTLAPLYTPVSSNISQLLTKCYNIAQAAFMQQQGLTAVSPALTHNAPKVLYILGQLCRHGAAIIDAAAEADSSRKNCTECLELCVALWHVSDVASNPVIQRVKDAALQAMGMLVIGRPQLMLQPLQLQEQIPATAAARVSDRGSPDDGHSTAFSCTAPEGEQAQQGGSLGVPGAPKCAAELYHVALSSGCVSVKSRVLTNLVELLRSEEAALMSRQKDAEAASNTSRLASTNPNETKAPLAKVNGATDAAADSSSDSIVQRVWEDVLKLATGVSNGIGSVHMGTPGHAVAAAAVAAGDAAQMRRKALELIEVVMRGGLVAPWTAVAPLVALLTDEALDTQQAALKALRAAADKYIDFVLNQLAPGVIEAFNFQSRLWNAKHPGQPLPKSPGPGVLEGLTAMYQQILAPVPSSRSKFLLNLLKPFAAACNLADSAAAAREDVHKLAFIAFVAAALPFKKADEPLVLIYSINSLISRQAQESLNCLKHQLMKQGLGHRLGLEADEELEAVAAANDQADAAGTEQQLDKQRQRNGNNSVQQLQSPLPQGLLAPLKASLALCMLLALKQYLMAAYSLVDDRVAAFALKGEKYRAEQKALVSKSRQVGDFSLQRIDLKSQADATGDLLVEQYKVFKGLLECDASNYKEVGVLAGLDDLDEAEAGLDASHVGATPAVAVVAAAAPARPPCNAGTGLVLYSMDNKKLARIKSAAKGASTAGKAGSTAGKPRTGRGSSKGKGQVKGGSTKGAGRKRRRHGDSEDSDEDWGEGHVVSKELF